MNHKNVKYANKEIKTSSALFPHKNNLYSENVFSRHVDETDGEKSLWKAVITQALMDAGSKSPKQEAKFDRAQAISWLSGKSKDFATVCALAGFDPNYVLLKSREALKRGCSWRINKIPEENTKNSKVLKFKKP